ncbi:MAG: PAS domain S-box protein [Puia sp.]|nr:PAS domain S-box protein [Puia sp.]
MDNPTDLEFKESAFFEMTPDLVCIAGKDGFFRKVNPAVLDKLGYTSEELMSRPISSFIHPEDKPLTRQKRKELLNGKALVNFQNRYITKTGAILWLEWTSIYFSDREIVFAIAKNITERKEIEIEIENKYRKFKGLTAHFKSSMEEDRKYLANELHEELSQLAAVLQRDLEWLGSNGQAWEPSSKSRMEHALGISKLLMKTIRRISFSISPNMIGHLGLNATLERHCREFSLLNGIPCNFESSCDEQGLTEEVRIDLFRICQEALMNILYHAQAGQVKITIEDTDGQIRLTIVDDGKGFDANRQNTQPGFIRMRERAASINGQLTIRSGIGKGTTISVTIVRSS